MTFNTGLDISENNIRNSYVILANKKTTILMIRGISLLSNIDHSTNIINSSYVNLKLF